MEQKPAAWRGSNQLATWKGRSEFAFVTCSICGLRQLLGVITLAGMSFGSATVLISASTVAASHPHTWKQPQ